jgi:hypothetical protein
MQSGYKSIKKLEEGKTNTLLFNQFFGSKKHLYKRRSTEIEFQKPQKIQSF